MRLFEITLIILLLLRTLLTLTSYRQGKNWRMLATLAVCAGLVAHLFIEGWRWQMIPFYIAAFVALTVDLTRLPSKLEELSDGRSLKRTFIGLAGLGLFAILPAILPVLVLPKPTGEQLVGSFSFELEDKARAELYSEDLAGNRRVIVRVWYPVIAKTAKAPWIEKSEQILPMMAKSGGLPGFMLDHLRYTQSHAFWNADIKPTEGAYPVVFFEHGLWGHRAQNTFLVEDLASHGYVVFAVEHPYGALHSIFEDGSTATYHGGVLPDSEDPDYEAASKRLTQQWADDLAFVLDYLSSTPSTALQPIVNSVDFEQIGLVGHSTGGASSLSFCGQDDRCAAVVVLDAWMQAASLEVMQKGLSQPLLSLFSDLDLGYFEASNQTRYQTFLGNHKAPVQTYFINKTGHHDFDDTALLSPIARFFGYSKGSTPAKKSFEINRNYVRAQFDHYLLGKGNTLMDASVSPYAELERAYEENLEVSESSSQTQEAKDLEKADDLTSETSVEESKESDQAE